MCLHLQSVYLHVANFKLLIMIKIVTKNTFTPNVLKILISYYFFQNNPPMKGAFQMLDGEKKLIVEGNLSLFI